MKILSSGDTVCSVEALKVEGVGKDEIRETLGLLDDVLDAVYERKRETNVTSGFQIELGKCWGHLLQQSFFERG